MRPMLNVSRSVLLSLGIALSGAAGAVDGVVLLDQSKALNGNATPGDSPGFPITISQPGSYRLDSNLVVPNRTTNAIEIAASNVTIDLNGFAIVGPCPQNCQPINGPNSSGHGIVVVVPGAHGITIRNGSITGVGADGINLQVFDAMVDHVHVDSSGANGMLVGLFGTSIQSGSVIDSTSSNNALTGIQITNGIVHHNLTQGNGGVGIVMDQAGVISNNVVIANNAGSSTPLGISASFGAACESNVMSQNQILCSVNIEPNVCNGSICTN